MYDFLKNFIVNDDMANIYSSSVDWGQLRGTSFYITGAAGMLASYFTYFLIYLNEVHHYEIKIYAEARDKQKAKDRFGEYIGRRYFCLVEADVLAEVPIKERVDYVIHAASLASPQYYGKMPVETMLPNIVGTYRLLEYGKREKIKGFIFFSSGTVYGTISGDISEENFGTLDFLDLGNSYSESKRCGEAMCKAYFSEYGVPVKSARIHHTYGPTMDIENDKRAFSEFTRNIINYSDIILTSDGSAQRGFCYISDAISALFKILLKGEDGESYNLGNMDAWVSMKELAEILVNLYPERGLKLIFQNREDSGYKLSPEQISNPVNLNKLKKLGWAPKISIREGFKRVIDSIEPEIEKENLNHDVE